MPAETPSLESTASLSQPAANLEALPSPFDALAVTRRSWVWASVPPIFLLGLCLSVRTSDVVPRAALPGGSAMQTDGSTAGLVALPASLRQGILPASQTIVVGERGIAGFASLRGTLEGASGVRGRAPMAGQIARVLVKPGQQVAVNDRVIELSDASMPRSSSRAERVQSSAESAQVAAVNQQESLQSKMLAAQQRLAASQKRVNAAQARLVAARSVVEKLQRGESVSAEDVKPARLAEAPTRKTEIASPPKELLEARKKALAEAEKSQQQVSKAADAARAASRAVAAAEDDVKRKTQKIEEMRLASDKVQKLFDSGAAKASDVDAARAGLEDAQADAQTSATRLATARKESARLHLAEGQAKSSVQEASKSATQSLQNLQLFADAASKDMPEPREEARANSDAPAIASSLSLDEAVKMVRNAIEESDAAAADAKRIKTNVDDYERQVNQTKNRLDTSSQKLEAAQQKVLDETIEKGLSVVRAPANGTVLSVASVASNVNVGDTIIRIGRSDALQVKLTDNSGAWRTLKTDMVLTGKAEPAAVKLAGGSKAATNAPATVNLRITEIQAPEGREKQAIITAVVENDATASPGAPKAQRLQPGMSLVCSVVKPGERRAILVPASSVIAVRSGVGTVAVLSEQPGAPANSVQGETLQAHRIEWREVRLGVSNGVQQEIASGLNSGERIALQPVVLQAYAKSTGASEVQLETKV